MRRAKDGRGSFADERLFPTDEISRNNQTMAIWFAILICFLLGIGNFALHKAVLESGHPLLGQMPGFVHMLGGRMSLLTEFMVLLAAMLLIWSGWPAVLGAYFLFSLLNGVAAWMILTNRI